MKKIVVNILMISMVSGTAYSSELERASLRAGVQSPNGYVFVGEEGEEDLAHALHDDDAVPVSGFEELIDKASKDKQREGAVREVHVVRDQSLDAKAPKDGIKEIVLIPGEDESSRALTIRDCKLSFAGALVGGYIAGLMHDSYGVKGGVVFSILTSAAAVAAHSEKNISLENRHLLRGFASGTYLPLMVTVFFKRRK